MLIDQRVGPQAEAPCVIVAPAVRDLRSASPVNMASAIDRRRRRWCRLPRRPPCAARESLVETGSADGLHEPVLVPARHPDQRGPAKRCGGVRIGERDLCAAFAPASSHMATESSPASGSADAWGARPRRHSSRRRHSSALATIRARSRRLPRMSGPLAANASPGTATNMTRNQTDQSAHREIL